MARVTKNKSLKDLTHQHWGRKDYPVPKSVIVAATMATTTSQKWLPNDTDEVWQMCSNVFFAGFLALIPAAVHPSNLVGSLIFTASAVNQWVR